MIVIVVELIVVVAFGIRLALDVQSTKLNEDIEAKEGFLRALSDAEARFYKIQNKTNAFQFAWTTAPVFSDIYAEINRYLPVSASEISIQVDNTSIVVSGRAQSNEIGDMENAFKDSTTFRNTELVQIESQGEESDNYAEFTLRTLIRELPTREMTVSGPITEPT